MAEARPYPRTQSRKTTIQMRWAVIWTPNLVGPNPRNLHPVERRPRRVKRWVVEIKNSKIQFGSWLQFCYKCFFQDKKEKDSGAPKRPQSAYFLWMNANREAMKKKHPGLSITEMSKAAGEAWRGIDAEEKKVTHPHPFIMFYWFIYNSFIL